MITLDMTDCLGIIQNGLPPVENLFILKKMIVVGAGMAGLVAAYELLHAGHEPLIPEARTRAGGRIYTLREPFAAGLYGEAGAMRIPRVYRLTMRMWRSSRYRGPAAFFERKAASHPAAALRRAGQDLYPIPPEVLGK